MNGRSSGSTRRNTMGRLNRSRLTRLTFVVTLLLVFRGPIKLTRAAGPPPFQELFTLRGHRSDVKSVAFGPNGRLLASGSQDKTVRVWDIASGKEIYTLQGHTGAVQ